MFTELYNTSVETNVSIIVACIPTMKPLYVSLAGKLRSKRQSYGFVAEAVYEARRHSTRAQGSNNLEPPYALTTYPSSNNRKSGVTKDSGSEKELRSDAGMPGVT